MDISLYIKFLLMKPFTHDHKMHVIGKVSQHFDLGLSFNSMSKNGICELFKLYFLNFIK